MEYIYEAATEEIQNDLNDKNFKVVFDDVMQEYQIHQFIPNEGWVYSAGYKYWNPQVRKDYRKYYYQSHEGRVDHQVWREAKRKERARCHEQEKIEAAAIGRETGEETWKILRDGHAVKRGVY